MPEPLAIATPSDREIAITRRFEAPADLVWLCYTKPELLRRWYGLPGWTMPVCDIDLRVGGRWRFVSRSPDGFELGSGGAYTRIERPTLLANTELYDADWTGGEANATLTLAERDGHTIAVTTVLYSSREARDGALASPMAEGMEIGFQRLDEVLADQSRPHDN